MKKEQKSLESTCSFVDAADPRVRRTRKLLQDAFRSLIHEKAFSAITVQDIAERATVNRATFYAHFTDKQDLASASLKDELRAAVIRRFPERPDLTRENLVEFAVVVFGLMENGCPETAKELQDTVGPTLQEGLYENIFAWISESPGYRRLFPGSSRETVATVLAWSIYGGAHRWSRDERHPPAITVCQEIISLLLPAVPEEAAVKNGTARKETSGPAIRQ